MANISLRKNEQQGSLARQQQQQLSGPSFGGAWDPFRMMERLLRWDPLQDQAGALVRPGGVQAYFPNFEVKETKNAYLFRADLPGVNDADIEISVNGNQLTISGQRVEEQEDDVQNYFVYERSYGNFTRTFTLPDGADVDHIHADCKDGVLKLIVPKRPEVQPRRIPLRAQRGDENKPKA